MFSLPIAFCRPICPFVDGDGVRARERAEVAEADCVVRRRGACDFLDRALCEHANTESREARGHADLGEELLHLADAGACALLIRARIDAEDGSGEVGKARRVVVIDVPRPRSPERGERHRVRRVVARGELVTELVHREVLSAPELRESAVRDAARPHELAHRVVVLAADEEAFDRLHDGEEQLLGDAVGEEIRLLDTRKVALHRVHHDVRRARRDLFTRQGEGELGVHKGDDRTVQLRVQPDLAPRILVREHRRIARLAARSGDCEDGAKRHGLRQLCLARPDVPDIDGRICDAVRNRLCRVDDTAAADGKDEVHIRCNALADRLAHERDARVRADTAHDEEREPRRREILLDAREESRALGAAAPVEDEHAARPERAQFFGDRILCAPPEDHLGGTVKGKALHENPPLYPAFIHILIIAENAEKKS